MTRKVKAISIKVLPLNTTNALPPYSAMILVPYTKKEKKRRKKRGSMIVIKPTTHDEPILGHPFEPFATYYPNANASLQWSNIFIIIFSDADFKHKAIRTRAYRVAFLPSTRNENIDKLSSKAAAYRGGINIFWLSIYVSADGR
jgi:hypothetical protein